VHALPSLQFSSETQQNRLGVCERVPWATLRRSSVQADRSAQSESFEQQPLCRDVRQRWVEGSHSSAVQASPSSHWAFDVQHPSMLDCVHWFDSQASAVQAFPSSQSAASLQQPVRGVFLHSPVATSHESAVHTSASSQSPSAAQQPATAV
jgi:hypothetical protein